MSSCQCQGCERFFSDKMAQRELKSYRKKGAGKATQILIDVLSDQGIENSDLLDIGGGVGAIQFELIKQGISSVVGVDGSSGYLGAAQEEAERLGVLDKVAYQHGNFVELASDLEPVDVVTLDKVICCFDDMKGLVSSSVGLAQKYYGVVFPIDAWWLRVIDKVLNSYMRIVKNPYRAFTHATEDVEKIIFNNGLKRIFYQRQSIWQVIVYAR